MNVSERLRESFVSTRPGEDHLQKGHYRRARAGELKEFTGISAPYEEPENPDLVVDTSTCSLIECVNAVLCAFKRRFYYTECSKIEAEPQAHPT